MLLLTGGSGLLGSQLKRLLGCAAPPRKDFDILEPKDLGQDLIVHCAAYTDVLKAESEPRNCFDINVIGTKNMSRWPLVYVSTEYVFDGRRGDYREEDSPSPLNNYAYTKYLGELEARKSPRFLIVRTLFKPRPFEHEKACIDQWTSGDYVDEIAPLVSQAVKLFQEKKLEGVIHLGTGRKTTYDLAKRTRNVRPVLRAAIPVKLPRDTSLNLSRMLTLLGPISGMRSETQ